MNRGTLGDTSDENGQFRRSTRRNKTGDPRQQLSPIRNPYEKPSTSRSARSSGDSRPRTDTTASNARQTELSNIPARGAARRKNKTYHQRQLRQLREIVKLQKSTNLQIPKAPFARVVREISLKIDQEITHYTAQALQALHEAAEMYLTQVLQDAYLLTLHRNCVTLAQKDMELVRALKFNM